MVLRGTKGLKKQKNIKNRSFDMAGLAGVKVSVNEFKTERLLAVKNRGQSTI